MVLYSNLGTGTVPVGTGTAVATAYIVATPFRSIKREAVTTNITAFVQVVPRRSKFLIAIVGELLQST